MKVFVFTNARFPENYHSSGGLVVVAKDAEDMVAQIERHNGRVEYSRVEVPKDPPDIVYEIKGKPEPAVYPFPDAGCC